MQRSDRTKEGGFEFLGQQMVGRQIGGGILVGKGGSPLCRSLWCHLQADTGLELSPAIASALPERGGKGDTLTHERPAPRQVVGGQRAFLVPVFFSVDFSSK